MCPCCQSPMFPKSILLDPEELRQFSEVATPDTTLGISEFRIHFQPGVAPKW